MAASLAASRVKPVLYSYFISSCSWRVRIALALKGIEYDYKAVHLVKDGGEQYAEGYKTINPQSEVPSLEIDGRILTQSLAIIEYLDETRDTQPHLLPRNDPVVRAEVRRLSHCIASGIQPYQNLKVLQYVGSDKKAEWAKHWIEHGFTGLEQLLSKTAGKYCVGDEVTMADLCLVPQVYHAANRFGVNVPSFPIISRINVALSNLDAVKVAHPSQQPDCPDKLQRPQHDH